jgi:hypothetical protein
VRLGLDVDVDRNTDDSCSVYGQTALVKAAIFTTEAHADIDVLTGQRFHKLNRVLYILESVRVLVGQRPDEQVRITGLFGEQRFKKPAYLRFHRLYPH